MEWRDIENIQDEKKRINEIYNKLDESKRLKQKNSSWVEYLVVMSFLKNLLHSNGKIIDIGAGAGAYSIPLADMGNDITAIDLVENNIRKLKAQLKETHCVNCLLGDATCLNEIPDNRYDLALLMGPLYHLCNVNDRIKALNEALRVLKPNGYLFMTFLNNDIAPFFTIKNDPHFFIGDAYNHYDFHMKNNIYVFHTIEEIRTLYHKVDLRICHEVAVDGLALIYHEEVDAMNEVEFNKYMDYHMYVCEKKEFLAASSHILVIGRKG